MNRATVADIKRFAVHDGDGIRTTVFLKGCPLKCVWCHNPESIGFRPQLAYYKDKCITCGECVSVCPYGAHTLTRDGHSFQRNLCTGCGRCENVCLGEALKLYGREMTVEQLLPLLLEDKDFYAASGGGVTLSGGECLMQPDFCAELLYALKCEGIHTAVDTCGFVSREALDKVIPYTDIFLYDIKAMDEKVHITCTGQSNRLILDNIQYINSFGKLIEVRVPYVPGFNDDQIPHIGSFLKTLENVRAVKLLPYHNYASGKYTALDMENTLPGILPGKEELDNAAAILGAV